MKIGFDIQPLEGPDAQRGIGKYTFNLLKSILRFDNSFLITLLGKGETPPDAVSPLLISSRCTYEKIQLPYLCEEYLKYSPLAPFDSEQFKKFDLVHLTSPLMPDTLLPCWAPCRLVATIYDLIPLIFKEDFNTDIFPPYLWRDYLKRIETITSYDMLLCISQQTGIDLQQRLKIPPERIKPIMTGVNELFFQPVDEKSLSRALKKWRLRPRQYIFTVGGFNPRKNMEAHFLTFAHWQKKTGQKDFKFVITCRLSRKEEKIWRQSLSKLGISSSVVLTNEVSDGEIRALYEGAAAFLFLSRYEGFGLPVAEACVCFLPVVASSIPTNIELLGEKYPFLVSPDATEQAAEYLNDIISSPQHPELQVTFQGVREKFRWDNAAQQCVSAYRQMISSAAIVSLLKDDRDVKRSIAIVSPLDSSVSGIADYIKELVPYLVGEINLLLFADRAFAASRFFTTSSFSDISLNFLPAHRLPEYLKNNKIDLVNYQLGNNITHAYGYFNLRLFPGIVTLHDLIISPFLFEISRDISPLVLRWELGGLNKTAKPQELFERFLLRGHLDYDLPLLRNLKENARAIIVHNNWMKEKLAELFAAPGPRIFVVPMGIQIPPQFSKQQRQQIRQKLGIGEKTFVLISFGNITPNKRLDKAIEAFAWFHRLHPDSVFFVIGNFLDAEHKNFIINTTCFYDVKDAIRFWGFVPVAELTEIMAIADLCINLRYPTFGETSATLLRSLAMGIPTLISAVNQYLEYPDSCTFKIPPDSPYEVDLVLDYLCFFANEPEVRQFVSEQARQYILQNHTLSLAASRYLQIFKSFL